jgi:hypothetical protein
LVIFLEYTNAWVDLCQYREGLNRHDEDLLLIQPKLHNDVHQAPRTHNQAAAPPSGASSPHTEVFEGASAFSVSMVLAVAREDGTSAA